MSKVVKLNGGPMHGQHVSIEDGRDHIHIIEPVIKDFTDEELKTTPEKTARTREGIYSQVRGEPHQFEWDGWGASHD